MTSLSKSASGSGLAFCLHHIGKSNQSSCGDYLKNSIVGVNHLKTILNIIYALTVGLLAGIVAGWTLVLFAPCSWFGSSFEGACGYGAVYASIALGFAVTLLVAMAILVYLFRRDAPASNPTTGPVSSRGLTVAWGVALVAQYLGLLPMVGVLFGGIVGTAVSMAGLVAFIGLSVALAKARGKHPLIASATLIPLVGPLITAALLFWKPSNRAMG